MNFRSGLAVSALALASLAHAQARPAPLVILSIDGMKPEYVTHAAEHGLKIPELRSFLADGTYAEGVVGVLPTVTYPSHTTLVTGVWPAEHGVVDNTTFDPLHQHPGQWYWDYKYIKVPTLYTAADAAGLKTAAIGWPVTVGAPIDYLIAEDAQSERTDKHDGPDYNPPGILDQLNVHVSGDEDALKTAQSIAILRKFHPTLTLIHLTDLDEEEHGHGPFSAEADAALEVIDAQVKQIADAAHAIDPRTRIAIVSDHGFLRTGHSVNMNVLFAQAGLITLGPNDAKGKPTITAWQAEAWPAGGSAAIVLRDPNDKATLAKVRALLEKAKADPQYQIAHLLTHEELTKAGAFPQASFLVDFHEGYQPGGALTGDVVVDSPKLLGMHGYLPSNPEMRSTFMIEGEGIAHARDLHVIDMRQIAPTFAGLLHVTLPNAKQPPVNVKP